MGLSSKSRGVPRIPWGEPPDPLGEDGYSESRTARSHISTVSGHRMIVSVEAADRREVD